MPSCLIELQYLPSLHYFSELAKFQTVILERHEHFVKQSYRSRCIITTSQGPQILSVPLASKHGKTIISEVRIDYSQKWLNNHWRAIQSAYAGAPFFEYYSDDLHTILFKQHPFLFDMNRDLLTMCLRWLKLDIRIEESLAYEIRVDASTTDLRNVISAKNQVFPENPYQARPYMQVFGSEFVNNLSLIDLIFCTGPKALTYLS